MRPAGATAASPTSPQPRHASTDNLKTVLVVAVIVGHTTMAWTGFETWVFDEPPVREPLLSLASLLLIGGLFGMAVFFCIAGMYTPPSLARKGASRFLIDRALRLGAPMVFFVAFLSPVIEYADPDALGWDRGFWAFAWETWWPPAPGPTWFLGVLLVFSFGYVTLRAIAPRKLAVATPPTLRGLAAVAAAVGIATYLVRLVVPLGEEVWHLAVPQAPGWVAGFALGVLGAERGWFAAMPPRVSRWARGTSWVTLTAVAGIFATLDLDRFGGDGTVESLVAAMAEGVLVIAAPIWLIDLFRRRFDHQGPLAKKLSRAAFAAFVVHQLILVGLVLITHSTPWPPEVEYLLVSLLGVAGSFFLGSLAIRIPAVARIV